MRSSAAHCYDQEVAQHASVFCLRRPALYLASVRHADGRVVTLATPDVLRTCANDSYVYDPLKQIVQVKDDRGNLTTVKYDHLGRRTAIDNPDTGKVETVYDLASNPTQKITAVLKLQNKAIDYDYDHNRLITVTYPNNPGNNIRYEYGDTSAAFKQYIRDRPRLFANRTDR